MSVAVGFTALFVLAAGWWSLFRGELNEVIPTSELRAHFEIWLCWAAALLFGLPSVVLAVAGRRTKVALGLGCAATLSGLVSFIWNRTAMAIATSSLRPRTGFKTPSRVKLRQA
jgi:hypothetical protein